MLITELQRLEGTSREHWVQPPCKAGSLQQVGVQVGLEYLQRRRIHSPWGQPVPVLRHPYCEEVPSHIGAELPMLQFMVISPCPVPTDCWKEVGHVPLNPTLKIFININQIPSQSSFLKAEQTQVAQPFLIREVLQGLLSSSSPPAGLVLGDPRLFYTGEDVFLLC